MDKTTGPHVPVANNGPAATGSSGGTIQSVQRGLMIMEIIGSSAAGVSAQRIASQTRLNQSTVYNILRTLIGSGYVAKKADGRYGLGVEVSNRYADMTKALSGPADMTSFATRLTYEMGYSVYVGSIISNRITITHVSQGTHSPHVEDLIVGFDDGAHATAVGKSLLATLPTQLRDSYLKDGLRKFTRNTHTDTAELNFELDKAAQSDGVYTEMAQFRDGVACASVVAGVGVINGANMSHIPAGDQVAISVAVPLEHMIKRRKLITKRLLRAAVEFQQLGVGNNK